MLLRTSATVVGLDRSSELFRLLPYRSAISFSLNRQIKKADKTIRDSVRAHFTTSHSTSEVSSITKSTRNTLFATVAYKHVPHPLADFRTTRTPHLNGGTPLFAKNGVKGWGKTYIVRTQVFRAGPLKLVGGKQMYGGFSAPGAPHIMARDTKERYPVHVLWGLSLSQMVMHKLVQRDLAKANYEHRIATQVMGRF